LVKIVTDLPCTVALAVAIIAEEVLAGVVAAAVGAVVGAGVLPPVEVEAGVPQATASRATSNNGAKDLRMVRFKNMVFPPCMVQQNSATACISKRAGETIAQPGTSSRAAFSLPSVRRYVSR
jgi:hypothetical protein